jgi:hypothetical protein
VRVFRYNLLQFQRAGDSRREASEPSLTPEAIREDARRTIALALVAILTGTLILSFALTAWMASDAPDAAGQGAASAAGASDTVQDVAQTLASAFLTPVVGLIGAAMGFYYGGSGDGQATGGAQRPRRRLRRG